MELPFVGTFILKNNTAAISFNAEIAEETKGVTAKNHFVNKLFSSSISKHNLQILDHTVNRSNPMLGLGGALKLTSEAD
jgi:hypothetical protein